MTRRPKLWVEAIHEDCIASVTSTRKDLSDARGVKAAVRIEVYHPGHFAGECAARHWSYYWHVSRPEGRRARLALAREIRKGGSPRAARWRLQKPGRALEYGYHQHAGRIELPLDADAATVSHEAVHAACRWWRRGFLVAPDQNGHNDDEELWAEVVGGIVDASFEALAFAKEEVNQAERTA